MRIRLLAIAALALACASSARAEEDKSKMTMVLMSTSMGDVKIALDKEKAPITVENFLSYVKEGFYDGTIFHRVIPNFMIQGGGFTPDMKQKPTKPQIKNEATNGLKNDLGTIAMARTGVVDSATSQFFINTKKNDFLNHTGTQPQAFGYCVFGSVVEGLDIVQKIEKSATTSRNGMADVPVESVLIRSIKVVE